jgi:hypothetical protein
MRPVCIVVANILLATPPVYSAETLGEVLKQHGIASTIHATPGRPITSYGILDEPATFCIAFYWLDNQTGTLGDQLEILSVNRDAGKTRTATLRYSELVPGKPHFRTGSITRIVASPNFLFLSGHDNPSAGKVLVLSRELSFQTALSGWPLATFDNDILVFHKSQIHFAPIHAAEIAIYDPHVGREEQIYPRKPFQEIRLRHIEALRKVYEPRPTEWFMQRNHPTDPEWFNNYLVGDVAVSDAQDALAFVIAFDHSEVRTDESRPQPTHVIYVIRGIGSGSVKYKEILQDQLEPGLGVRSLTELLDPRILGRIFP